MNTPTNLKYANSDEWLKLEGGTATVGITDYAQSEIGEIVYLELPEVGRTLAAGEACGVVESVKAVSEIYTPVGGEVTEVNSAAADDPSLVNASPFEDGWLVKLRVDNPDTSALMDADAYASSRTSGH